MKRLKMAPVNEEQLKPYITRFKPAEQKQLIAAYKNYPGKDGILDLITDGYLPCPPSNLPNCNLPKPILICTV